jgi:hypothetical protein
MGGLGALKYTQHVPTGSPFLLGDAASAGPSSSAARGPSVATTTARASSLDPSAIVTDGPSAPSARSATDAAGALRRTLPAGSLAASWSDTTPIPPAGRQFAPVASMRITNMSSRLLVPSPRSKNMPPRKGLKNLSTISSENPSRLRRSRMLVSGCWYSSSMEPSRLFTRSRPTRILSVTEPMGFGREAIPSTGCRNGSATRWNPSFQRTEAPA